MGGPRQRGQASSRSLKDLKRELNVRNEQRERERLHVKMSEAGENDGSDTKSSHHLGFQPWTPSAQVALKLLISARLGSAVWSTISDCDETFNYWEPAHQLLYGSGNLMIG